MAIDGHRLQYIIWCVVDNVYRRTPSPTYVSTFFLNTSYDVLMYQVGTSLWLLPGSETPFRKLSKSFHKVVIYIRLYVPVDPLRLHDGASSSGHPIAAKALTRPQSWELPQKRLVIIRLYAPICGASRLRVETTPWTIDTTMVYCADIRLATLSIDVHCPQQ